MQYLLPLALALMLGGVTFWVLSKHEEGTARKEEDKARLRHWQDEAKRRKK